MLQTRPARGRLTRRSRIGLTLILVLALSELLGLGTRYYLTDHRWLIVDNAQVDGDEIEINAPAAGVVTDWRIDLGSPVADHQLVGFVELQGAGARPKKPIRSSGRGTVAQTTVTEGEYVEPGTLLAVAYGDDGVYVTARVPEREIHEVRIGAPVDILLDAAPDEPVTGTVARVGAASAGVFELQNSPDGDPTNRDQPVYPGPDTDPLNPQPVEQYIPVTIRFVATGEVVVRPGMNVTVHIQRP